MKRYLLASVLLCGCLGGGSSDDSDEPRGDAQPGDPCEETRECIPGSVCFNRFCVGEGTLRVSLAFDADSDFDLHVVTPSGSEIYYGSRENDGGQLDVDQCVGGCGEPGTHVENVVFDETALAGQYSVWVENYNGGEAGAFEIEVSGDTTAAFSGTLPATAGAMSETFTFTL